MNKKNRILTALAAILLAGVTAVGFTACDDTPDEPDTTPDTTVEVTAEPTEPETEAPTEPETQAPATEAPTDAPATEAPTEPETQPAEKKGCGSVISLVSVALIALVSSAVIIKRKEQ